MNTLLGPVCHTSLQGHCHKGEEDSGLGLGKELRGDGVALGSGLGSKKGTYMLGCGKGLFPPIIMKYILGKLVEEFRTPLGSEWLERKA